MQLFFFNNLLAATLLRQRPCKISLLTKDKKPPQQHRFNIKTYLNRLNKEQKIVDGINRTETTKGIKQSILKSKTKQG